MTQHIYKLNKQKIMDYAFIYNTLLGFFGALLLDLAQRNKESQFSPKKFDIGFYWKDNRVRLMVTFLLSIVVMLTVFINVKDAATLFGKEWEELNNLIYIIIGAVPDLVISFAKRKVGFLRPDTTKGYIRNSIGGELPPDDDEKP